MKIHTSAYKNKIKEFGRQIDSIITYTIDNEEIELGSNELNSITPHYESNLLKSIMKQLDIDSNVDIPVGTEINYILGTKVRDEDVENYRDNFDYVNFGNYIVFSSEKQEDSISYKIVCYDKMLYSMKDYETLGITYPITIRNYIKAIATHLGLEFANENDEFANYDKEIPNELYLAYNDTTHTYIDSMEYTFRDVLDELSQVTASNICINENDELEVRYITDAISSTATKTGTNINITDNKLSKILNLQLLGDTNQTGTPSPSSPVNIDTVTGQQDIVVCGKNLFNKDNRIAGYFENNGTIINGSTARNTILYVPCLPNTKYSISASSSSNLAMIIFTTTSEVPNYGVAVGSTTSFSLTNLKYQNYNTSATAKYLVFRFQSVQGVDILDQPIENFITNFQIEEGSTATTYEPYKNKIYGVNLGKNLIDLVPITNIDFTGKQHCTTEYVLDNELNKNVLHIVDNGSYPSVYYNLSEKLDKDKYYKLKFKYKLSTSATGTNSYVWIGPAISNNVWDNAGFFNSSYVKTNTGTTLPAPPSSSWTDKIIKFKINTTYYDNYTWSYKRILLSLGYGNKEKDFYISDLELSVISESEYNSTDYSDVSYTPYFTPIELCKIGDYQDKIYKQSNKWYIHKEIGKVDLSTLSWTANSHNTSGYKRYTTTGVSNIKYVSANTQLGDALATKYKIHTGRGMSGADAINCFAIDTSMVQAVDLEGSTPTGLMYYALLTPTNTEITNETLINELEQASKLKLYDGINNVISNGNLGSVLSLSYVNGLDTIDENYLKDINVTFGEKYGPVNSIVLSRAGDSDKIYLRDEQSVTEDGLCEINISENQIMNFNDRDTYLPDLLEKLDGLEYYLNDFSSTGITYYDVCDRYGVKIGDTTYNCIMFNDEVNITQGLEENIHTDTPEQSETDYTKADKTDRKINQTYIIVDKQNQVITSVVNQIGDRSEKQTTITQDLDSIESQVQNVPTITTEGSGTGSVFLENLANVKLISLRIHPTNQDIIGLLASNLLTVRNGLKTHSRGVTFDGEQDVYYSLPDNLYYYDSETYDEFFYDGYEEKIYVIRKVGFNGNTKYILDTPVTEEYPYEDIIVSEGNYNVFLECYPSAYIYVKAMIKNDYTTFFATSYEVDSKITQTADTINLEVSNKVDNKDYNGANIMLKINSDESQAQINADKVDINATDVLNILSGNTINLTSKNIAIDSTNFKVDKDGNMIANSGTYSGTLNTTQDCTVGENFYVGQNQSTSWSDTKYIYFTNDTWFRRVLQQNREWLELQAKDDFRIRAESGGSAYIGDGLVQLSSSSGNNRSGLTADDDSGLRLTGRSNYININESAIQMTAQPTIISDIRKKKNIEDIDTNWIDELKVKEYEYKNSDDKQIGLIAQDYENKEYSKYFLDKDEEGYYSIRYGNITNALIQYCQEMKKEINSLKEEIKQLKESDK